MKFKINIYFKIREYKKSEKKPSQPDEQSASPFIFSHF
jgi:hypothetical protein